MMTRLSFFADPEINALFPEKRLCYAVLKTKDGRTLRSELCEPEGEAKDHIGREWLSDKFRRMTDGLLTPEAKEEILRLVFTEDPPVRKIISLINESLEKS